MERFDEYCNTSTGGIKHRPGRRSSRISGVITLRIVVLKSGYDLGVLIYFVDGAWSEGGPGMALVKNCRVTRFQPSSSSCVVIKRNWRSLHAKKLERWSLALYHIQVMEFLLATQELCEMNYPADTVEVALVYTNTEKAKAVEFLELVKKFKEYGFKENNILECLQAANNDGDKALEYLMTLSST